MRGSIVVAAYPLLLVVLGFYDRRELAFVGRPSRARRQRGAAAAAIHRDARGETIEPAGAIIDVPLAQDDDDQVPPIGAGDDRSSARVARAKAGRIIAALGLLFALTYGASLVVLAKPTGRVVMGDAVHYYVYLRSAVFDGDLDFENDACGSITVARRRVRHGMGTRADRDGSPRQPDVDRPGAGVGAALSGADGRDLAAARDRARRGRWLRAALRRPGGRQRRWPRPSARTWRIAPRRSPWRARGDLGDARHVARLERHLLLADLADLLARDLHARRQHLSADVAGRRAIVETIGRARWLDFWALASLVRWQDAVLLDHPRDRCRLACEGWQGFSLADESLACGLAAVLAFLPQMMVWNTLPYGSPFLVPQGEEFMKWTQPALVSVLFSEHGLISWTPIVAVALAGLAMLWKRRPMVGGARAAMLVSWYANAAVADWWAGSEAARGGFVSCSDLHDRLSAAIQRSRSGGSGRRPARSPRPPSSSSP